MSAAKFNKPGVHVDEVAAFPPSVVGVQTALPAFIGYTEKAVAHGEPVANQAVAIGSLDDFVATFGADAPSLFRIELVVAPALIGSGAFDFKVLDPSSSSPGERYYALVPSATTRRFSLYNCLRLFYANGGGNAFVISVGSFDQLVDKKALLAGLEVAAKVVGPTMLVVPEALLLPGRDGASAEFKEVVAAMLGHCQTLQDRVAILDVYGAGEATQKSFEGAIRQFRQDVGAPGLSYGIAYFPFVETSVVSAGERSFENIENLDELQQILGWEVLRLYGQPQDGGRAQQVQNDVAAMSRNPADPAVLNQNLIAALPLLQEIEGILAQKSNLLPAAAAMPGVYAQVDADRGVWNAPANIALSSVLRPSLQIDSNEQGDLNAPLDGKAVNAVREFTGRGSVVWGARTLDGNSNDYRYIQIRRTIIYIEQSIKSALQDFVFASNNSSTWSAAVALVSGFLTQLYTQGALLGDSPSQAFTAQCGLGSTMTAEDILEGYMIVQVTLQLIRPAEFIELSFKQKLEGRS